MKFDILTLFPEIFPGVLESSILGRAVDKELLSFNYINIRDYSKDKHKRVDDYPYGGGLGMIMQPQPIFDAYSDTIKDCKEKPLTVFLSPRGQTFNQSIAKEIVKSEHIVLICGHYEGIDQRVIDEIADYELSVGDYILTGGELGAMIVCDAVSRLVPGVLTEEESFVCESHFDGLLEYPQYTRPKEWNGKTVPEVLLNGNEKEINSWREEQALIKTEIVRPDLFYKSLKAPYCSRNTKIEVKFSLISFSDEQNREEIFKKRRKYARKLKNQGFNFEEIQSVFTDAGKLKSFVDNQKNPIVLVCDNESYELLSNVKVPIEVLCDVDNNDSLYPYFSKTTTENVADKVLEFLSIQRTVEKYSK